jgi:hypothetical protein
VLLQCRLDLGPRPRAAGDQACPIDSGGQRLQGHSTTSLTKRTRSRRTLFIRLSLGTGIATI